MTYNTAFTTTLFWQSIFTTTKMFPESKYIKPQSTSVSSANCNKIVFSSSEKLNGKHWAPINYTSDPLDSSENNDVNKF